MRIARVIGKIVMNKKLKEVLPASYLVVRPLDRGALARGGKGVAEELVVYDDLGAREGDLIGLVEGMEATAAFYPARVPYDAYNACILDSVNFQPVMEI